MKLKFNELVKGIVAFGVCTTVVQATSITTLANGVAEELQVGMINEFDYENGLSIVPSLISDGYNEYMQYNYSYKGMTQKEFKDAGLYMAVAMSEDGENWSKWSDMGMYAFEFGVLANYGGYIKLAVVDYPMDNFTSYKGDLATNGKALAVSNAYSYNVGHVYNQTPSVLEVIPTNQQIQNVGEHKVTVKFDEHLVAKGEPSVNISYSNSNAHAVVENIKIENTKEMTMFNGEREVAYVTFDLKADDTYAGHYANYHFEFENIVGEESDLAPSGFNLSTAFTNSYCNGTFNGVMRAEEKFEIKDFDVTTYKFSPVNAVDTGVVVVEEKDGESIARPLTLNCEEEMKPFKPLNNLDIGVNFIGGIDEDATYKAYRYVNQVNGEYKVVELETQLTEKGLKVIGKDTLK